MPLTAGRSKYRYNRYEKGVFYEKHLSNAHAPDFGPEHFFEKFFGNSHILIFLCVFPCESIPMPETHLDNRIVQNRYIPFSTSAYPSAWQAEP